MRFLENVFFTQSIYRMIRKLTSNKEKKQSSEAWAADSDDLFSCVQASANKDVFGTT